MKYDTVLGLGNFGCSMALLFAKKYNTIFFDTEEWDIDNFVYLEERDTHQKMDEIDIPVDWVNKVSENVLVFVCGSGIVSGCLLSLLEKIKDKKINIVYFAPLENSLTKQRKRNHELVFNVVQEYTRSGLFNELVIFDEKSMLENIPEVTLLNKYEKINEYIFNILENIKFYSSEKVLFGNKSIFSEHYRISSVGFMDVNTGKEIGLYNFRKKDEKVLDVPLEKHYYYVVSRNKAENDDSLLLSVYNLFEKKIQETEDSISYSVHVSDYEKEFCYFVQKTSQTGV